MGITITEDEADKKHRGYAERAKETARRHANDTHMADEIAARPLDFDQTAVVNADPRYVYHLVDRRQDGKMISRRKGQGYETVPADAKEQLAEHAKVDGVQVNGDLVLMRTPVANYERRAAQKRRKWQQMSGDRTAEAKENLNKIARDGGLTKPHQDAVTE